MSGLKFDAHELLDYFDTADARAIRAVDMYAAEGAKKMENYAKRNRTWTDRTGHARQRLHGWVEKRANSVRIYIGHGVDYGYQLEMKHQQRFAILNQTINALGPSIVKGFKGMLKEISK